MRAVCCNLFSQVFTGLYLSGVFNGVFTELEQNCATAPQLQTLVIFELGLSPSAITALNKIPLIILWRAVQELQKAHRIDRMPLIKECSPLDTYSILQRPPPSPGEQIPPSSPPHRSHSPLPLCRECAHASTSSDVCIHPQLVAFSFQRMNLFLSLSLSFSALRN